jgi:Nucleotidyl transferase AbiEii toxin, Type IV TA system
MSFSNAPDEATLGRVAGALAVEEAFVEKDWYVVEAIRHLVTLGSEDIAPVFSGGTSLLKGFGLIKRFSEDIDFKFALSAGFLGKSANQQRKILGGLRDALVDAWKSAGFLVTSVEARDANGFLKIEMDYPSTLEPHGSLRPHILAELSAKPPRLPVQHRPLASFVVQYAGTAPEIASIACIDPVETAADKLSAFAWRMLLRDRSSEEDDATIVRHLHDLAALETAATESGHFPELLRSVLADDSDRGGGGVAELGPRERLAAMCIKLADDPVYNEEYGRFVGGMAFAGAAEVPTFEAAVSAVERLCERLQD